MIQQLTINPTFKSSTQTQRQVNPQIMRPMSRDEFELMQAQKKEKNKQAWYKAGIIGGCVLAVAFATQAVISVLTHKTNKQVAEATIKSMNAQAEYFKNNGKEKTSEMLKNIFEDISKAEKLESLALSDDLVNLIQTLKNCIENPESTIEKGGDFINSILFYGPPGTGKTTIAKAIANMFPDAKFATLDVTKMKDKYVGETEKNINALIDKICKEADVMLEKYYKELGEVIGTDVIKTGDENAINKAMIKAKEEGKKLPELQRIFVFADEIDSVMMVDTGSGAKISNDMLNEFKKGFTEKLGKRKNIVTIGATNLEINAEKAMTLDGKMLDKPMLDRFNVKQYVGNPTKEQLKRTIVRKYEPKSLVEDCLKDVNSTKLDELCQALEGTTSFRDLDAILKLTGNRTKKDAAGNIDNLAKVNFNDIYETLVQMKESLGLSEEALQQLFNKICV